MARMAKQVADLLALLKREADVAYNCAESFENDGDKEFSDKLYAEAFAYYHVINLIEDKEFYQRVHDIWFPAE